MVDDQFRNANIGWSMMREDVRFIRLNLEHDGFQVIEAFRAGLLFKG